jgi:hypothetical protein
MPAIKLRNFLDSNVLVTPNMNFNTFAWTLQRKFLDNIVIVVVKLNQN